MTATFLAFSSIWGCAAQPKGDAIEPTVTTTTRSDAPMSSPQCPEPAKNLDPGLAGEVSSKDSAKRIDVDVDFSRPPTDEEMARLAQKGFSLLYPLHDEAIGTVAAGMLPCFANDPLVKYVKRPIKIHDGPARTLD